jgi:hypothetical protein
VIRLYALADGLRVLPDGLRVIRVEGLDAVVGEALNCEDQVQAAVVHGRIVESLRERADAVLPVRLGEDFADDAALTVAVAPRADGLSKRLEDVRGCVEIAVRVVGDLSSSGDEPRDGASYMRMRLEPFRLRNALEESLHAPLERRAKAARVAPFGGAPLILEASYLVSAGSVDDFAGEALELASAWPRLSVTCTGPWAPYSFAEGEA